MDWTQFPRYLLDVLMVWWFFLPLKNDRPLSAPRRWGSCAIFLLLLPVYLISGGAETTVTLYRLVLRSGVYTVWLYLNKNLSFRQSLYLGLYCWSAFTTENNIFITPQLSVLRWDQLVVTAVPWVDQLLCKLLEYFIEFLILTLMSRAYPWKSIDSIDRPRFFALSLVVVCELYIKHTLKLLTTSPPEVYRSQLTVYPILLQCFLSVAFVLFERYLFSRARQTQEHLAMLASRYRYQNAQTKARAEADLHRLHHDLKNHLLALKNLAGHDQNIQDYIQELLSEVTPYEFLVSTGNTLLDGLLSEKLRSAEGTGIDLNIQVDFHRGNFVQDMDVCAIFGNALDNALEASSKVRDPELRNIMVRCSCSGEALILTVRNYYEGELLQREGRVLSQKQGAGHGIGLSSIRRSAERYGGTVLTETDAYHNFILTVLLPLPATEPFSPQTP